MNFHLIDEGLDITYTYDIISGRATGAQKDKARVLSLLYTIAD
jgi:hypothetical protein